MLYINGLIALFLVKALHLQTPIAVTMIKMSFETEMDRIKALSEYNLDYTTLCSNFDDLTQLAAKFAGTDVSLVNLLDSYQQWTVGQHGIAIDHMPREESVCQYTIQQKDSFEVPDLAADERFNSFDYVAGESQLKYYYGVPITTASGHRLGALCVLDKESKQISADKADLLKILAREVVNRLNTFKQVEVLQARIQNLSNTKRILAHDLRGPLSGIIGLAQLGSEEISREIEPDAYEYFKLITESGRSAINLAEDILNADREGLYGQELGDNFYDLSILKTKLQDLFMPRVLKKKLYLTIKMSEDTAHIRFHKARILQVLGNLTANAIKFTPSGGRVDINLELTYDPQLNLKIKVADTGMGMSPEQIDFILKGKRSTTTGTQGEVGYGLGLSLVKQIVEDAVGSIEITSVPDEGSVFTVALPAY